MDSHTIYVKARCSHKTKNGRCKKMTIITHPYCAQHTRSKLGLYVAPSQIKGAGMGLYTTRPISKGTVIVEYKGEKLTTKQYNERYDKDDYGSYGMEVNSRLVIDARKTSSGLARYVCDHKGSGKKPNTEYQGEKQKVEIVAIKNIEAGEELLINYGNAIRKAMGF